MLTHQGDLLPVGSLFATDLWMPRSSKTILIFENLTGLAILNFKNLER